MSKFFEKIHRPTSAEWGSALVMLLAVLGLGYGATQASFGWNMLCYVSAFLAYLLQASRATQRQMYFWLLVAVVLRLALIGAFPKLSDDIYRFVWDGRLWLAGFNPFDQLPTYYLEPGRAVTGLSPALFAELNSPEYYTIYPPVAQALFAFAVWCTPDSVWATATIMQVALVLMEIGTLWLLVRLLQHWQLPPQRVLWYALNPLIIVEVVGNLHFEGAMIFFLLLGLWCLLRWQNRRGGWWLASAGAMAMAVASKLLPLLFFSFLIKRLRWRSVPYFAVLGMVLLLSWVPLLSASFIENFASSVNLYFRRFEFNGSLYYLLRGLGYQLSGYNLISFIGPGLALLVFLTIMLRTLMERPSTDWRHLPERWLFAITVYLLCATTVHPWYSALPLVLCVFTHWRWPVLWTGLITLTYINYSYAEYQENLWVVGLEYVLVLGYALWENRRALVRV